jgi:PiT family inorganic phosphate transporter
MVTAWLITLPSAGLVGAVTYLVVHGIGGFLGAIVGFSLLSAAAFAIWLQSRKVRIDHTNVNHEWEGNLTAGLESTDEPALKVNGEVPQTNGEVLASDAATPAPKAHL